MNVQNRDKRATFIYKKFPKNQEIRNQITWLLSFDPDQNTFKNSMWMVRQYDTNQNISMELMMCLILEFHEYKKFLPSRDLNDYSYVKNPQKFNLKEEIRKVKKNLTEFPDGPRIESSSDIKLIFREGKFTVHSIHSYEACKRIRKKNKECSGWCVGWSVVHYSNNTDNGRRPLYLIQTEKNRKFLLSFRTKFCNFNNLEINLRKFCKNNPIMFKVPFVFEYRKTLNEIFGGL